MEAKELRIGNYVKELDGRLINLHDGFGIDHFNQFIPIEITEEWLIKLGFEKDEIHECIVIYQNDIISLDLEFSCNSKTISIGGHSCADEMNNCKYIHQLQNLYYALTGNELVLSGI